MGDIDAFLLRMLKNKEALQLPPNSPSKLKYFIDFMKLWQPGMKYEVLKLYDINPWFFEIKEWLGGGKS